MIFKQLFLASPQVDKCTDLCQCDGPTDLATSLRPLASPKPRAHEAVHSSLHVTLQIRHSDLALTFGRGLPLKSLDDVMKKHSVLQFVVFKGSLAFGTTEERNHAGRRVGDRWTGG